MPASVLNYRWIFAVATAVVFPALILHTTCVAVMGPGTWGSGVEEVEPRLEGPTPLAEQYRQEFIGTQGEASPEAGLMAPSEDQGLAGVVGWTHSSGDRVVYLTEDTRGATRTSRVYATMNGQLWELPVPPAHAVNRPQWAGDMIVYERWNPWAVPPVAKLQRYISSWADASLRPEASLYACKPESTECRYLMPGHSLEVAPDGRRAALLRSGALLAGYYSIHIWDLQSDSTSVVVSLREHNGNAAKSFSLTWSADSLALRIHGRTDGFDRRSSRSSGSGGGIALDLIYLVPDGTLHDLSAAG